MAYLAPSILSADFSRLAAHIAEAEKGGADILHMDVMDGAFVPNISFGVPVIKAMVGKTNLNFDVHLMIERPDDILEEFVSPQTEYITVHQEACRHLHRTLQHIKSVGCKAGVSLNPATPLSSIEELLGDLDLVLIMSVNPGFGGQKYIEASTDKIKRLAAIRKERELGFMIEVDGGVDLGNAVSIKDAGADILVAGSAVFGAEDVAARVAEFKKLIG
ncbi:MAG TPA: ribulose-phosphate 3-epimerase [Bacillota bacterium]|nr:ribulose-phosphate 3-epimerase [Bacillota bacterium]HQC36119.1 ribulose-phosphate 3-epimerase [Bacillota bacterium]